MHWSPHLPLWCVIAYMNHLAVKDNEMVLLIICSSISCNYGSNYVFMHNKVQIHRTHIVGLLRIRNIASNTVAIKITQFEHHWTCMGHAWRNLHSLLDPLLQLYEVRTCLLRERAQILWNAIDDLILGKNRRCRSHVLTRNNHIPY